MTTPYSSKNMITEFELSEQFQPFYKSGKQICVTADGYIIADDGDNVNYINRANLQKVANFNKRNEEVTCFAANPNDYTVVLANKDFMLRKIDRFNKEQRHKIWNSRHTAPIFAMCLNHDSTRLTTGAADNKVRIWHIGQGEGNSYNCNYHKSKITVLKNHPTENVVVSASMLDMEILAWNTENGKQLGLFSGHQQAVTGVDFHEETNQMISSSRDATVIIWNFKTFLKMAVIPALESVETCIVLTNFINQPTSDQFLIMVGGENGIMKTISPSRKAIVQEFKKSSLFANVDQNETKKDVTGLKTIRTILNTDESIIVVRESDNIEFYSKNMQLEYELAGELSEIRDIHMVGKDGNILLAVESAPYMRLFSCDTFFENPVTETEDSSKLKQWPCQLISGGHTKDITSVAVFDGGLMVVSGGKDGKVCIWKIDSGDKKLQMKLVTSLACENNMATSVCVDRTGKVVYVYYSFDDALTVLSLKKESLNRVCSFTKPHGGSIATMDVNMTGSLLATGSKDKSAKIWSYCQKSREIVHKGTFNGHKRGLWSVKFSKLEQILLTSSMDSTIKMWSIEDFSCISTFQSEYPIYKAMFYNEETKIISCDEHGLVSVWDREKRNVIKNIDVHDEAVDCLTLITDSEDKVQGFAAAGPSSMISLYKDCSEKSKLVVKEAEELEQQQKQEFENLMVQRHYSQALKLAIKLNKPVTAYQILNKIQEMETEEVTRMDPIEMSENTEVGKAINNLEQEEMQKIFMFAIKWNTNAKTFIMGQRVIAIVLCAVPNSELLSWPEFADHIVAMSAYSSRHYRRIKEEGDRMAFFDYLKDVVNTYKVMESAMDTC